jgi:hypothetical protein
MRTIRRRKTNRKRAQEVARSTCPCAHPFFITREAGTPCPECGEPMTARTEPGEDEDGAA